MKNALNIIFAGILLFTFAATSLHAQTNSENGASNIVAVSESPTNAPAPVRIDNSGLDVGGSSPVNINNTPNFETPAVTAALAVTAIVEIIAGCSIPIAIVAVVGLIFYFRNRRNKMLHETLRAMLDKGVPIPPELFNKSESDQTKRPRNDFRTGLILISLGAGVAIFNNHKAGFIVLFVGAAYLVASLLEKKSKNDQQPPKQ
jgi:hypothetical protein